MKQEQKQLLFKDLCSRLPFEVKVQTPLFENPTPIKGITNDECWVYSDEDNYELVDIEKVRPYLRSMSTMTEEEENEYRAINCYEGLFPCNEEALDYVLEHHFDFRGLIPMGLGLESPEGMYKTE